MLEADAFLRELARRSRVILIGGIAVVLHGLQRVTEDVDIWLDPGEDASIWAMRLSELLSTRQLTAARVEKTAASFESMPLDEVEDTVQRDRFVRVLGLDRPVDIFRVPNNFHVRDFDAAWRRSHQVGDGIGLMDEIDLIVTKMDTGRAHDEADSRFLQDKAEQLYRQRLKTCSPDQAAEMLERLPLASLAAFAACEVRDVTVRSMGRNLLNDLAINGDPYAKELLVEIERHNA